MGIRVVKTKNNQNRGLVPEVLFTWDALWTESERQGMWNGGE